ncbi:MAG: hypothetical protein ACFCU7_05695 [Pleurocapsa sp.]
MFTTQPDSKKNSHERNSKIKGIDRFAVQLKYLPEPDWSDFQLPPGHIYLLIDDGSPLTGKLAETLTQQGWQVVVISFLQSLKPEVSLPAAVNRVVIENYSEADLQQQLKAIASKYGSIAAMIYLHPQLPNREEEHKMLKQVFFLAKYLQPTLEKAAQQGSSCFITVAHLDGELGTSGHGKSAVTGGLLGLTKALRWEWPSVFCRAIDLADDLDTSTSVKHILAELHDPNRLIAEVGYSSKGRTTLGVAEFKYEE